MSRVPLALIGAGRMGRMHLQALTDSQSLEVVTIVEPSEAARAAASADRFPADRYTPSSSARSTPAALTA